MNVRYCTGTTAYPLDIPRTLLPPEDGVIDIRCDLTGPVWVIVIVAVGGSPAGKFLAENTDIWEKVGELEDS